MKAKSGFSLIEVIIVIGILAVLTAGSIGIYSNYSKNVELDTSANSIISDLKSAQSKAINGEESLKWGIRFINGTDDYYEIFSTSDSYTVGVSPEKKTVYLVKGVTFSDPSEGTSKDIIYDKIRGTITSDTTVKITSGGTEKTINITALGNIY